MTRTVELNLTPGDMAEIAKDLPGCNWKPLWEAIGYLSSWASDSPNYAACTIGRDRHDTLDLIAFYRDAEGNTRYVIGAVWHDDHYGFHS